MSTILKKDRIYERIRQDILRGRLAPGEKLAPGAQVAKEFGVSHITLRSAMARLAEDGLIESIHGRGTFVCHDPQNTAFRTIGLVLPSMGKPLTPEESPNHYSMVTMIIDAANRRNFEIRTLHRGRTSFDSATIRNMGVDGVIVVFPFNADTGLLSDLRECGKPVLVLNLLNPTLNQLHHCLNLDFVKCGSDSVSYLYDQGRRGIAFATCYTLQQDLHPCGLLNGYMARMKELGLAMSIIQAGELEHDPVADLAEPLLRVREKKLLNADAVVTTNFHEALAVQSILREHGKRVPEDVAVLGFFDNPKAEEGALTTWRPPWSMIGRRAVELIGQLLQSRKTSTSISLIPLEIVKRASA